MDDNTKEVLVLVVQTVVVPVIGLAIFWQQTRIRTGLSAVVKSVNGHTETVIAAVKGEAAATGKAEGVQQERVEQRARNMDEKSQCHTRGSPGDSAPHIG